MTNLQQLQEETTRDFQLKYRSFSISDGENPNAYESSDIIMDIRKAQLLAYNQGVKDSVEALPKETKESFVYKMRDRDGNYLHGDMDVIGYNQYRGEAITNINKLMQ